MKKLEVQKRVLQNGKEIDLDLFSWDEKTNTFSSAEDDLVIDFLGIHNCTFKTGSDCTFKTGSSCTFKTRSYCTFDTGSSCTFDTGSSCTFDTGSRCTFNTGNNCTFKTGYNCTFKTGSDCTFDTGSCCTFKTGSNCTFNTGSDCTFNTGSNCVVVRRDIFEVILLKENVRTQLCPYNIKGHLEEIDGKMYLLGNKEDGEYIIVDNILSKVVSRKKNIIKVINYNETEESYIIEIDDIFSHGKTIKEAKESIVYKMGTRDLSEYKELTLDSVISKEEAIIMYRSITGACAYGTKMFVDSKETKEQYFDNCCFSVTIYKDADYYTESDRKFMELNGSIIESVSQLQFSNDTQNQIAEFTVDFKCVSPNIY